MDNFGKLDAEIAALLPSMKPSAPYLLPASKPSHEQVAGLGLPPGLGLQLVHAAGTCLSFDISDNMDEEDTVCGSDSDNTRSEAATGKSKNEKKEETNHVENNTIDANISDHETNDESNLDPDMRRTNLASGGMNDTSVANDEDGKSSKNDTGNQGGVEDANDMDNNGSRFGFSHGDVVGWVSSDADVPPGSHGEIIEFSKDLVAVKFLFGKFLFDPGVLYRVGVETHGVKLGSSVAWATHDSFVTDVPRGTLGTVIGVQEGRIIVDFGMRQLLLEATDLRIVCCNKDSGDHDAGAALGRPEAEDAQNALTASMQPEAEEADE